MKKMMDTEVSSNRMSKIRFTGPKTERQDMTKKIQGQVTDLNFFKNKVDSLLNQKTS